MHRDIKQLLLTHLFEGYIEAYYVEKFDPSIKHIHEARWENKSNKPIDIEKDPDYLLISVYGQSTIKKSKKSSLDLPLGYLDWVFHFDVLGNKISEVYSRNGNLPGQRWRNEYDSNNNLILREMLPDSQCLFQYDENSNLIKSTCYSDNSSGYCTFLVDETVFNYNADGTVVSASPSNSINKNKNQPLGTTYFIENFLNGGYKITTKSKSTSFSSEFYYNKQLHPVAGVYYSENIPHGSFEVAYEYDHNMNWIEAAVFRDNKITSLTKRKILYR